MPLFFLFYFILELYLLVVIGSAIGAGLTVLWVLGGFVVGMMIMMRQGRSSLESIQAGLNQGGVNVAQMNEEMLGRFMNLMAGLLILLPGFLTDFIGIALLILSPFKRWLGRSWQGRQSRQFEQNTTHYKGREVIEGEFYEVKTEIRTDKKSLE
jgi:UPF0716 protein FxsA